MRQSNGSQTRDTQIEKQTTTYYLTQQSYFLSYVNPQYFRYFM